MVAKIRRVVTGVNEKGQSVITYDGVAENVFHIPGLPGAACTELWVTREMPIDNTGRTDQGARPFKHDPDDNGTIFRIVELPPEEQMLGAADTNAAMDAAMKGMGSKHQTTAADRTRHPTMHMTDSVDYLIVLQGELTMIMDEGETTLLPGDCVVQRGTRHGWSNRGDKPVLLAAALVDAEHVKHG